MTDLFERADEPPVTPGQQHAISAACREGVRQALAPVVQAWDARSADMLAVLADAEEARQLARRTWGVIRGIAWLAVGALVAGLICIAWILEHERQDRQRFRELEQQRRAAMIEAIVKQVRAECRPAPAAIVAPSR